MRVPRSARVRTLEEAWVAAERIGLPLVFKPVAGAGGADTWIARTTAELGAVLKATAHVPEASLEELAGIDGVTNAEELRRVAEVEVESMRKERMLFYLEQLAAQNGKTLVFLYDLSGHFLGYDPA